MNFTLDFTVIVFRVCDFNVLRPNVSVDCDFLYNNVFCLEYSICDCNSFRGNAGSNSNRV